VNTLADRLRGVIRPGRANEPGLTPGEQRVSEEASAPALGGTWHEAHGHRFLVVDRTYLPGHRHGRVALADVFPPVGGPWPSLELLGNASRDGGMLFLDLETTGLAGGAGTYAFLVGCAWFDGGVLRIRQYFLSTFSAERALLAAVAEIACQSGTLVTYNGKTFDLPLLDTRFLMHRLDAPFATRPHVDMLYPARRLWRGEEDEAAGTTSSFKLSLLEETLLGHVRVGDVPGFEIPSRYFHYVRTGDARPLEPVFEHNRLDLLSLACVTSRAAGLLEEGPAKASTGRETYGLGRLYERAGRASDARACYARAAGIDEGQRPLARVDWLTKAEALRAYALLARRERRFDDAATAWDGILALCRSPVAITQQAIDALAVHKEHRLGDAHAARALAMRSLALSGSRSRRLAVAHRLARLNRKLGDGSDLFDTLPHADRAVVAVEPHPASGAGAHVRNRVTEIVADEPKERVF